MIYIFKIKHLRKKSIFFLSLYQLYRFATNIFRTHCTYPIYDHSCYGFCVQTLSLKCLIYDQKHSCFMVEHYTLSRNVLCIFFPMVQDLCPLVLFGMGITNQTSDLYVTIRCSFGLSSPPTSQFVLMLNIYHLWKNFPNI